MSEYGKIARGLGKNTAVESSDDKEFDVHNSVTMYVKKKLTHLIDQKKKTNEQKGKGGNKKKGDDIIVID